MMKTLATFPASRKKLRINNDAGKICPVHAGLGDQFSDLALLGKAMRLEKPLSPSRHYRICGRQAVGGL